MNGAEWKACAIALESFPGEFPARSAEAYRQLLEGLSYEEVMGAIQRHVRTGSKWRPSPGEIVALADRAVALPPFGAVREQLTRACLSTPVRLTRTRVGEAICEALGDDNPLLSAFVITVGGERIRRVVLYTSDDAVERAWDQLRKDYEGLAPSLIHSAFAMLEASEQPRLTP